MIPRLETESSADPLVKAFLRALRQGGFRGVATSRFSDRLVRSTDNSLYQMIPTAVVGPEDHADTALVMSVLAEPRFRGVSLTARGGGTGTSAAALTVGVTLDFSMRMNRILEIDPERRTARVEPGVVLETLNAAAREHGLMFGPVVSTANRATLGGMIANDSAGKGSVVYGKTSGSIVELRTLFADGGEFVSRAMDEEDAARVMQRDDAAGALCRVAVEVSGSHAEEIARVFPKLSRYPSGYNLAMIREAGTGRVNLNYLLAGSEGTLAVVTEATLRLVPVPRRTALVAVTYASFDDAVSSAGELAALEPTAIETMDEHLLSLVKSDESYLSVKEELEGVGGLGSINLVEFSGDDEAELARRGAALAESVRGDRRAGAPTGVIMVEDPARASAYWALRKRAVGLMGNLPGRRKPAAFVEDAAVPTERLLEFVRGFRAILDREGLAYGMYGHVDAGVIHVRPALDMTRHDEPALLRRVSDAVAALARECGGVLWGEHGKGVRGEYNKFYFGPTLDRAMRELKTAADPYNQLNPGKVAAPIDSAGVMLTIEASTRGVRDARTPQQVRDRVEDPFRCNGNALCHNEGSQMVMCPSWKETRDRMHSPKGRADLMREWLGRLAEAGADLGDVTNARARPRTSLLARAINRWHGGDDFSHEVYEAMEGCLACKACAGQCPVKVDVPSFRARFLQVYHDRYPRRGRDHLIGLTEPMLPVLARAPLFMAIGRARPMRAVSRAVGLVDPPALASPSLRRLLRDEEVVAFDERRVEVGDVVVVQDAFTTHFTPGAVIAMLRVARAAGRRVHLLPYEPTGKPLHVKGFLRRFARVAERQARRLDTLTARGADLVGIDPAATLIFRDEYAEILEREPLPVRLPQEWLADTTLPRCAGGTRYALFPHCTERACEPAATQRWREVFRSVGADLRVVEVGCCGMCGAYGHDRDHYEHSRGIFERGWSTALRRADGEPLATGYSCRSQAERFGGHALRHPLEALAEMVAR